MKLVEIGDGLKSILVASKYYSDWENKDTVFLYTGEEGEATIRISVISVTPKDESDEDYFFHNILEKGKSENIPVTTAEDKSYYTYSQEYKTEEESLIIHFYEIGYKWNCIIISITADLTRKDSPEIKNILKEIESFIPSITEYTEEDSILFEPKYTDFVEINERISKVLEINPDDINSLHEKEQTLKQIQQILDEQKYTADQTYELQSLGLAMGDYIQYKYPEFHWTVTRDKYGRDLSLQYKNLPIKVFPMTMISKRIEDNGEASIDIEKFVPKLISTVEENANSGTFTELDYNY